MVKIICDEIQDSPKDFFKHFDNPVLIPVCRDIDDLSDYKDDTELLLRDKKDFVNAINTNIKSFGLNYFFEPFNNERFD